MVKLPLDWNNGEDAFVPRNVAIDLSIKDTLVGLKRWNCWNFIYNLKGLRNNLT